MKDHEETLNTYIDAFVSEIYQSASGQSIGFDIQNYDHLHGFHSGDGSNLLTDLLVGAN